MKISAELIAIGILGVSLVSLGWKVSSARGVFLLAELMRM